MRKTPKKVLGFYRKTPLSNQRLVSLFEENQKARFESTPEDWKKKEFVAKLTKSENEARKEILKMLKKGEIKTSDDFYRAAWFFHHGQDFKSYALGVALASVSMHLGEPWGKNLYALALDRFLLSIKQTQYFGTQHTKKKGKWLILPYRNETTNKERKRYFIDPIEKTLQQLEEMTENQRKSSSLLLSRE